MDAETANTLYIITSYTSHIIIGCVIDCRYSVNLQTPHSGRVSSRVSLPWSIKQQVLCILQDARWSAAWLCGVLFHAKGKGVCRTLLQFTGFYTRVFPRSFLRRWGLAMAEQAWQSWTFHRLRMRNGGGVLWSTVVTFEGAVCSTECSQGCFNPLKTEQPRVATTGGHLRNGTKWALPWRKRPSNTALPQLKC